MRSGWSPTTLTTPAIASVSGGSEAYWRNDSVLWKPDVRRYKHRRGAVYRHDHRHDGGRLHSRRHHRGWLIFHRHDGRYEEPRLHHLRFGQRRRAIHRHDYRTHCHDPDNTLDSISPPVKVMTRNLYLGAELAPVFAASSIPETPDLLAKAAQQYQMVQATDFPARAKVLAQEITEADPILVGLQEASLWRRGEPGVLDGPATPATTVVYDFLQILLDELAAQGQPYTVLVAQFTGPTARCPPPWASTSG